MLRKKKNDIERGLRAETEMLNEKLDRTMMLSLAPLFVSRILNNYFNSTLPFSNKC